MLFIYDVYLLKLIRVSNDVVFENDDFFYSDRYLGKWGKKNGNEMEWLWR